MNLHLHDNGGENQAAATGTVVFLHGFPFNGSMWAAQLRALPNGWRGLAPDLRGFGDTGMRALPGEVSTGKRIGGRIARSSEPVLTMARLADDVAELIHAHAGGRAVVCGLSMGGYVALELWRRHPTLIRGLILADTRSGADDDEARENRLRMAQVARTAGVRPIAVTLLPSLLTPTTREGSVPVVEAVRTMILSTPPTTVIAALAGMAARHDSTHDLATISVPTLVLAGAQDTITPPDVGRDMAAAIPGASFVEIPDAGHLSNIENSAAFNAAVAEFLERGLRPRGDA